MLTTLVVNLTAGLTLLNIAGLHATPWWSIAVMFFGYGFVRSVMAYGQYQRQIEEEAAAEEAFTNELRRMAQEAKERQEK